MIEIRIERDTCFGSGECVLAVPSVFELDDVGIARIRSDAAQIDATTARRVAENCPSGAIQVVEPAEGDSKPSEVVT